MFSLRPYGSPPSVTPTNRKTFDDAGHNCSIKLTLLCRPRASESARDLGRERTQVPEQQAWRSDHAGRRGDLRDERCVGGSARCAMRQAATVKPDPLSSAIPSCPDPRHVPRWLAVAASAAACALRWPAPAACVPRWSAMAASAALCAPQGLAVDCSGFAISQARGRFRMFAHGPEPLAKAK
jgi:hypothetical protein